ncbi:MAG: VanZ family protein [candidate division WOR-3 bacterium]
MKRNVRRGLLILWILIIFVLTGYPKLEVPRMKSLHLDKLYHFIAFFILGFLASRLLSVRGFFVLGLIVLLLAEFQQLIIPGRLFELSDIAAGGIALVVSYFVCRQRGAKINVSEA